MAREATPFDESSTGAAQTSPVSFRVLGTVAAVRPDGATAPLARPRQRALLAALLLRPERAVPTERLIAAVWGESPPTQPGPALHTLVTRLRSYLEESVVGAAALSTDPLGYRLDVAESRIDSGRFDLLRREAAGRPPPEAVPLLEEAISVWGGDPYPGLEDEAARLEAIRLDEARLGCLEALSNAYLGTGRPADALEVAERLVAGQPLREAARESLIRALYDVGRHGEALAQYEDYRRLLADELGLEPSQRLAALQLAVLRQELPVAAAVDDVPRATSTPGLDNLRVRYADGPAGPLAYATAGEGPLLLHLPAWVTSIDVIGSGRDPRSSLLQRLARHSTVVMYDRAGTGLSRDTEPSADLDIAVEEARAVIAAVGAPVHVLAISQAGPVAVRLAVDSPHLVGKVVLMGTYASGSATFTNDAVRRSVVGLMRAHWGMGSRAVAELYRPAASVAAAEHLARVLRDSADGRVAADYLDAVYDVEVADLLPRVHQSVLVVHYRGDRLIPFRGGQDLATGLPNAELLALDGDWHLPDVSDLDRIEAAVVDHIGE